MTMPDPPGTDTSGLQAQVLLELGKISTQIAVITERLNALPDHENRIRAVEQASAQSAGGRDVWARVVAGLAVAAAVGATAADYLHH